MKEALFAALDAERVVRGLSWAQVARECRVSAATLTGMRERASLEGDGVLQVLLWLGRTPESFLPGFNGKIDPGTVLRRASPPRMLRFDARAIHTALDAQRLERGLSWRQAAEEIGVGPPSGLTRLANGGRVFFPAFYRIAAWLNQPVAAFTRPR